MRRQPMGGNRRFQRVSTVRTLPPPIGGWNRRDSLQSMAITDAVQMDNWFPEQSSVVSRPGYVEHCDTGEVGTVQQIMPYEFGTTKKLLCAVSQKILDITTATPSTLDATLSAGGEFFSFDSLNGTMFLCNGLDAVRTFNGTVVATSTFSGTTLADLNSVHTYKSRVYFVEKDSQRMWYGGVQAVSGALTDFDFGVTAGLVGNLLFTTHLKGDGGDGGADDVFIAVFEGGDVLAYSGSDPGDPTDWSLIGRYRFGRPLDRLAYLPAEDDVYVITDRGYEALSRMLQYGESYSDGAIVSNKIQLEVTDRIIEIGPNSGWRISRYPREQMMIFTIPRTGEARSMHVLNINTGAWCQFTGFLPTAWGLMNGMAYFGEAGDGVSVTAKIYLFGSGATDDNGTSIRCAAQTAWSSWGSPGVIKHVQLLKPFVSSRANPSISINVGSDYNPLYLGTFSGTTAATAAVWDEAIWNQVVWSNADQTFARWFSRNAVGEAIGLVLAVDASQFESRWNQTTVMYTVGGYL